jgi:hypothetical protein
MLVDELLAVARQSSYAPDGTEPTVLAGDDQQADALLSALVGYFSEDDGRAGVRLEVPGRGSAYIQRSHVYTFVLPADKGGFGSSDAWFTPGISDFRFVTVRCPADGAEFMVPRFDQRRPPRCHEHDEPMAPVQTDG